MFASAVLQVRELVGNVGLDVKYLKRVSIAVEQYVCCCTCKHNISLVVCATHVLCCGGYQCAAITSRFASCRIIQCNRVPDYSEGCYTAIGIMAVLSDAGLQVRIGGYRLPKDLGIGQFRELKPHEVRRVTDKAAQADPFL